MESTRGLLDRLTIPEAVSLFFRNKFLERPDPVHLFSLNCSLAGLNLVLVEENLKRLIQHIAGDPLDRYSWPVSLPIFAIKASNSLPLEDSLVTERSSATFAVGTSWEFSNEITIFSFSSKNLGWVFRSQNLLLMSRDFNYFRLIYFCLGHVLGTRISNVVISAI